MNAKAKQIEGTYGRRVHTETIKGVSPSSYIRGGLFGVQQEEPNRPYDGSTSQVYSRPCNAEAEEEGLFGSNNRSNGRESRRMNLRPYQVIAQESVERELANNKSTLMVLATGTGKTVIFSHLASRQKNRTLILAHRKELVEQAADKVLAITGKAPSIEMAGSYSDESYDDKASVVVASVQTMIASHCGKKRMHRFRPSDFSLVVIDEAHRSPASSYKEIIDYFTEHTNCKILGVTATPDRGDKVNLGKVFSTLACEYNVLTAINDGWLVPVNQKIVDIKSLSFDGVMSRGGDFVDAELARVMAYEKNLHGVAVPAIELCRGKQTVAFCASVDHAERLAEIWNRTSPGSARSISGKMPKSAREKLLSDFTHKKFQVLTSCMVLTEGWDCPQVEAIVMARPTKSRALYAQMLGRGTRPLAGVVDGAEDRISAIANSEKPELFVLDFCGNSTKHKLICSIDLLSDGSSDRAIEIAKKKARAGGSVSENLKDAEEEEKEETQKKELKKESAESKRKSIIATAAWRTSAIDPFCFTEDRPHKERPFSGDKPVSEKMRALLVSNGINPDNYSYSAAGRLCGEIIRRRSKGLCSLKQAHYLKSYGFNTEISSKEAGDILTTKWGRSK